jgi:hypothetical protein
MAYFWEEIRNYTARISTTHPRKGNFVLITDSYNYYIEFHKEGATLPACSSPIIGGRQHIYVHVYFDMFSSMIDMLRNEKPVYAMYRDDVKVGMITTSKEPIGEGEITAP